MYIHIGNKKIVSDKYFIGIFNAETLRLSDVNKWIVDSIESGDKSIAIKENNDIVTSRVSPFTVIKRTSLKNDIIWRRENE
ncbi:hypothetical protein ACFL20_10985 [Spirochaetota bacterium]